LDEIEPLDATNPAHAIRGPKHVVKTGKTTVLDADQARKLPDSIDTPTIVALRDRVLPIIAPLISHCQSGVGILSRRAVPSVKPPNLRLAVTRPPSAPCVGLSRALSGFNQGGIKRYFVGREFRQLGAQLSQRWLRGCARFDMGGEPELRHLGRDLFPVANHRRLFDLQLCNHLVGLGDSHGRSFLLADLAGFGFDSWPSRTLPAGYLVTEAGGAWRRCGRRRPRPSCLLASDRIFVCHARSFQHRHQRAEIR
jgi:hypothetical protein